MEMSKGVGDLGLIGSVLVACEANGAETAMLGREGRFNGEHFFE